MASQLADIEQLHADLSSVIRRIRSCIPADDADLMLRASREYRMQLAAFEERCQQADRLTGLMTAGRPTSPLLIEGEIHRLLHALELSLEFFRGQATLDNAAQHDQVFPAALPAT